MFITVFRIRATDGVKIGPGSVPSGNKPLHELMSTQIFVVIYG